MFDNKLLMLALDHRGSFRKMINPSDPESVSDEQFIDLKKEIILATIDQFTGVLVDQELGLQGLNQAISESGITKPYLLPVEESGYSEELGERTTKLEYSAAQLIAKGASAAKLLMYFNPNVPSAQSQIKIAQQVLDDCRTNKLSLFFEIRVYKTDTGDELGDDGGQLVLDSLKMLIENEIVPDFWKLEYPDNFDNCQKITELVGKTPWILLTRGSAFETFVDQLKDAVSAGAVGFLAGRGLWQEACSLEGEQKEKFLKETLPSRFKILQEVLD